MKAADLNRFLRVSGFVLANPELKFVCALISDLYCPGYNPRQSLEKNSNLAHTAGLYKIDVGKVVAAIRVELSLKKGAAMERNPVNTLGERRRPIAGKKK